MGYNVDMIGSCAVEDGSLSIDEQGYLILTGVRNIILQSSLIPSFANRNF